MHHHNNKYRCILFISQVEKCALWSSLFSLSVCHTSAMSLTYFSHFSFFIFVTSSLSPTSYLLLTIYHCNFFIKLHYHFVFLNFKFQHHETNDFTWLAYLRLYNVHIAQKWQQKKNMAWLTTYYTFKDVIIQIHIFQNSCGFYSWYTKLKVKSYH